MTNPNHIPDSGDARQEQSLSTDSADSKPATVEERPVQDQDNRLSVVGIGASAGGLAALRGFFAALPPDSGITFVVIVHLSAGHESHLAKLLQSATVMPVTQVTTRVQMTPNHIYVIPPGKRLFVSGDSLDLAEIEMPQGRRMQIDLFFRSLAEERGEGAAIILSGSGSDGTVGIQAIKEQGGLILVQSPDEAEYDSMPRSALATGLVDVVGPVAELAHQLIAAQQVKTTFTLPADGDHLSAVGENTLEQILVEVHQRTGNDFQSYKRSTILRRIGRRMQLTGQRALTGYLNYLRQEPEEAHRLMRELVIHVTQFFRDPDAWATLARTVIPRLFVNKGSQDSVRVWTAGCATGEESYTLAILLLEQAAQQKFSGKIQIFASDLSEEAIAYARAGYYPAAIAADVSEDRLVRFFSADGSYYRLHDEVRNLVLFAQHNLFQDPPFSKLDLLVCRNVLIYFQRDLQERICDFFYNALQPNGYLFLGSSEAAESMSDLFNTLDKTHHIYQRPAEPNRIVPIQPVLPYDSARRQAYATVQPTAADTHRLGLEEMGPPSLLIDADYQVLHMSPTVGRYLVPRGGTPTTHVLQIVRPELQMPLRMAIQQTLAHGEATFMLAAPVHFDDAPHPVALWVRPITTGRKQILVLFLEDEMAAVENAPADGEREEATREQYLAGELHQSEELRRRSDEHYTSLLVESRAAYEGIQTLNEEYKSSLEELETSKEELQSVNEELQLVNQELHEKINALGQAHNDLENFALATNIATLFLDRQLHILRYTPGAAELFNLLPTDLGRLITHLRPKVQYEELADDTHQVMKTLTPVLREVYEPSGRWFLVQVLPYRTLKNALGGVVITFTDITLVKKTEASLRQTQESLEIALTAAQMGAWDVDLTTNQMHTNLRHKQIFGYTELIDSGNPAIFLEQFVWPEDRPTFQAAYEAALETGDLDVEMRICGPDGAVRWIHDRGRVYYDNEGKPLRIAGMTMDVTREKEDQMAETRQHILHAQELERTQLAHEIHDGPMQELAALTFEITSLVAQMEDDSLQVLLAVINAKLERNIRLLRHIMTTLRPPAVVSFGLVTAIQSHIEDFCQQQPKISVELVMPEEIPTLPEEIILGVYRIVQQALYNVVQHAEADQVWVRVYSQDNLLSLEIEDNGIGFTMPKNLVDLPRRRHLGIVGMMERAQALGGELTVDSTPGQGTRIRVVVPFSLA